MERRWQLVAKSSGIICDHDDNPLLSSRCYLNGILTIDPNQRVVPGRRDVAWRGVGFVRGGETVTEWRKEMNRSG